MGGACSTYGGRREAHTGLWWGNPGERGHLDGRRLRGCTMDLKEIDAEAVGWIDLACDRDKWRALVNAGMDLCGSWNAGNSLTSCEDTSYTRMTLLHVVCLFVLDCLFVSLVVTYTNSKRVSCDRTVQLAVYFPDTNGTI